jgi:hypothetical protein
MPSQAISEPRFNALGNTQISDASGYSPFLRFVSNTTSFDTKFYEYTQEDYVTFK